MIKKIIRMTMQKKNYLVNTRHKRIFIKCYIKSVTIFKTVFSKIYLHIIKEGILLNKWLNKFNLPCKY